MATDIQTQFEKMGARVRVRPATVSSRRERFARERQTRLLTPDVPLQVDVRVEHGREFFDILYRENVHLTVPDCRPTDRHLLLVANTYDPRTPGARADRDVFLCGHDERHWFVAAIPERAGVYNVQAAKDALKPALVWEAMADHAVPMAHRDRRRTAAFVHQGEWFFIPRPRLRVSPRDVIHNEPIQRGAGKPHLCEHLFRTAGHRVYVCDTHPNGLTEGAYYALPRVERNKHHWRQMFRDANVFVKGSIRHPDHKTLRLEDWHHVVMNTETQSRAMRHVAFLD
jgi:hypothetical protein